MKASQFGVYAMALALAGCSSLSDSGKRIDYGADASRSPTLEVPPDLTAPAADEAYKIPQGDAGAIATYSAYKKGGVVQSTSAVLPDIPGVRLERSGTQRWLRINDKPDKVWPIVKAFWQGNGLSIKSEEPAAGVMETDWIENRAKLSQVGVRKDSDYWFDEAVYSVGERDQYVTRLERSKDGQATEVHITHRGMEEVFSHDKKVSQWQARGNDPEKEAVMLQRLMVRFGSSDARAKDALVAAAPAATPEPAAGPGTLIAADPVGSASLREYSGTTFIVVNDTFDKAWRRVGLAIESSGLAVEDKDREQGVYYLRPIKLEQGWWDKLKFWKSSEDTTRHYRVNVRDNGTSSVVTITDQNDVSTKASKEMLEAVFKNINKR